MRSPAFAAFGLVASVAANLAVGAAAHASDVAHPAVVELFQSQGCSSCPPANANLLALEAKRPDILALSWQVTYWDDLGWKDTFSKPAFTARQWDYAHAFHRDNVGTPEVVVNGRADVVGSRPGEIEALIREVDRGVSGPEVQIADGRVTVGAGEGRADVVLVRYDPNTVQVPIRAGENGGRTLPHRNVVHEVVRLGELGRRGAQLRAAAGRGRAEVGRPGPGGARRTYSGGCAWLSARTLSAGVDETCNISCAAGEGWGRAVQLNSRRRDRIDKERQP